MKISFPTHLKKLRYFAFLLLFSFTSSNQNDFAKIGDFIDNFSLKNIDNKMVSLNDFSDKKGIVVVFTCNTCPYAQKYEKRIIDLYDFAKKKDFALIAINPNDVKKKPKDSFEDMQSIAKEKQYPFPYLRDDTQKVATMFGAKKTPHTYILTKQKEKYKIEYIGAIDDNPQSEENVEIKYVESALTALSEGNKIKKSKTVAIGCTIKWK